MSSPIDTQQADESEQKSRSAPKMSFGRWLTQLGWRHLVAILATLFAVLPVTYIIGVALNPVGSLSQSCDKEGIAAISCLVIPTTFSLENFQAIFTDTQLPYTTWFKNSLIIATVQAAVSTILSASGAYAFSRMRFKGRRPGLLMLVLLQMFPQILAITAIFILMTQITDVFPAIGLGTASGLILVYLGGSLGVNTYLIKGFFDTIPVEIDESAKIDGAGHARIFFDLILRLAAPVLAVVFFVSFAVTFNELAIAQTLMPDTQNTTLAVGLQSYVSGNVQEWGKFAAGALVAAIPMIALFAVTQKHLTTGLTAGAVKG